MDDWFILVVIDTNIWISALINPYGAPARLMQLVMDGRVRLVVSAPLLDEVHGVIQRSRIRRRIDLTDLEIDAFLAAARETALTVRISGDFHLCRDPKDDLVVETALLGKARYVVSRDEDLTRDLDLVRVLRDHAVEVLTVARFLELLDAEPV